MKITVVGLGLIGGSFVKGLKDGPFDVFGLDMDPEIVKQSYEEGCIQNAFSDSKLLASTDVLILCLYPKASVDYLRAHQYKLKSGCIVTDVAGLKVQMVADVNSFIREDVHFIGGHPMAGREGQGYARSTADIFKGANYLLMSGGSKACYEQLTTIIKHLGCAHIEVMTPEEHDAMIAYTSHMPHILAAALVYNNESARSKHCIAGSFKEITRVADFNEKLWAELFLSNRQALLSSIASFQSTLDQMARYIESGATCQMVEMLEDVREKKMQLV